MILVLVRLMAPLRSDHELMVSAFSELRDVEVPVPPMVMVSEPVPTRMALLNAELGATDEPAAMSSVVSVPLVGSVMVAV